MSDIEPVDGLAIRKAIAEKVFGWRSVERTTPRFPAERIYLKGIPPGPGSPGVKDEPEHVPRYELDIAAAWTVVLYLIEARQMYFDIGKHQGEWTASFDAFTGRATTEALAVCRAALMAVEG